MRRLKIGTGNREWTSGGAKEARGNTGSSLLGPNNKLPCQRANCHEKARERHENAQETQRILKREENRDKKEILPCNSQGKGEENERRKEKRRKHGK